MYCCLPPFKVSTALSRFGQAAQSSVWPAYPEFEFVTLFLNLM